MNNTSNKMLTAAIGQILRPLARILLRNGIACGSFEEMVRKAYVDEAFAQARRNNTKPTISSVSAETGLSRKEVKRLHETELGDSKNTEQRYNRAIRVISGWLNDPQFAYAEGNPRALSLDSSGSSFAKLVKQYSGDIPTRAMLNLLEASNCVEVKDGLVHLVRNAYIPGNDPEEILRILGSDTSELINTIDHNLTADDKLKWFQRKVSNPRVRTDKLTEFKKYSSKRSQTLLEDLDTWLNQNAADDDTDSHCVSMSIYYNEKDTDEVSKS
jgi:AraC-like DNA-binding protein